MSEDAADGSLELKTGRIHYQSAGAGDPVLVLHHSTGNPGWIPFYAELAREFAVEVPDLPGYGQSERPDWARSPRDLAILIGRYLEGRGLQGVTLVGLGLGGFVAAELACMNPSRLERLVLVGAAGVKPERGEIADQMMLDYGDYVRQGFRDDAAHDAVFGGEADKELRTLWDFSREMTARISWKPYMFDRSLPPLLGDMRVPTLLVWGSQDRIVPPVCGEQYARLLPDARLHVVEGGGHLLELEEPEALAALVAGHARAKPLAQSA